MSFKTGSLQRDYTLCSQFDDALDLPDVPEERDDETEEQAVERKRIAAERAHKLKVARERSDWSSLVKPGHSPTMFHFRQIPGASIDWWHGQNEKLGGVEGQTLLLRLALKSIQNLDGFDVKHDDVRDSMRQVHRLVSIDSLNKLYEIGTAGDPHIGRKIVGELAGVVAVKTFGGLLPLS